MRKPIIPFLFYRAHEPGLQSSKSTELWLYGSHSVWGIVLKIESAFLMALEK